MKSPGFWDRRWSPLGWLLAPLGWVYTGVTAWRLAHGRPWKAPVPVICVGNLSAGGAGKTPIVRDLALRLKIRGYRPGILSRGYGGEERGPLEVEPGMHTAAQVGDEPLLLARDTACWIAADRVAGVRAMVGKGIDIVIMDDGLQNPSLAQDIRLLAVDGAIGFGNGHGIPAGPLRESIGAGIARVDAMIVMGQDERRLTEQFSSRSNILQASAVLEDAGWLAQRRIIGFAGIGRPNKFRTSLAEAGADIREFHAFADHHPYTDRDMSDLLARAERLGAELVTTEKDWVRLSDEWRRYIKAIAIGIVWKDEPAIEALIDRLMGNG
jgi:tetraacyldisaccharide 4'-kinase